MKISSKSLGFTLVELLVVIGIIGILSAVAIAMFEEYKRKANDAAAMSQANDAFISLRASAIEAPELHCEFTYEAEGFGSVNYGSGSNDVNTCLPGFSKMPHAMVSIQQYSPSSPTESRVWACHKNASVDNSGNVYVAYISTRNSLLYVDSTFSDDWGYWSNLHDAANAECIPVGGGGGGGADTGGGSAEPEPSPSGGGDTGADTGSDSVSSCGCGSDPDNFGYQVSEGQCCSIGMKTGCAEEGEFCLSCEGYTMDQCSGGGDTGADTGSDTGGDTGADTGADTGGDTGGDTGSDSEEATCCDCYSGDDHFIFTSAGQDCATRCTSIWDGYSSSSAPCGDSPYEYTP